MRVADNVLARDGRPSCGFGLGIRAPRNRGVRSWRQGHPKGNHRGPSEWRNPHTQIHLDVTDDKGNVVHWNFEAQPPNILTHAGWSRETLKPGDQVTIVASPAKNGAPVGIIQKVVLASGEELTMTEK